MVGHHAQARGTPRGISLATATTSAAFFPHLEQPKRLRLLAGIFSAALDSARHDPKQATTELDSRRNRT